MRDGEGGHPLRRRHLSTRPYLSCALQRQRGGACIKIRAVCQSGTPVRFTGGPLCLDRGEFAGRPALKASAAAACPDAAAARRERRVQPRGNGPRAGRTAGQCRRAMVKSINSICHAGSARRMQSPISNDGAIVCPMPPRLIRNVGRGRGEVSGRTAFSEPRIDPFAVCCAIAAVAPASWLAPAAASQRERFRRAGRGYRHCGAGRSLALLPRVAARRGTRHSFDF